MEPVPLNSKKDTVNIRFRQTRYAVSTLTPGKKNKRRDDKLLMVGIRDKVSDKRRPPICRPGLPFLQLVGVMYFSLASFLPFLHDGNRKKAMPLLRFPTVYLLSNYANCACSQIASPMHLVTPCHAFSSGGA